MHNCMCVTHVPWCMSGSLPRGDGENIPGIPSACATRIFTYLVRGRWLVAGFAPLHSEPVLNFVSYAHKFYKSADHDFFQRNAFEHKLFARNRQLSRCNIVHSLICMQFTLCIFSLDVFFTHMLQGYFTGTGAIIWLPQCQWSNPERYR